MTPTTWYVIRGPVAVGPLPSYAAATRLAADDGVVTDHLPADKTLHAPGDDIPQGERMERTIDAETGEILPVNSKFELMETGLMVNGEVTYDEWRNELAILRRIEGGVQWWIGDCLNYGEPRYGEKYAQAVDETEAQTWGDYANIAARYEIPTRVGILSWSHHREIAYLKEPLRSELLQKASENRWSVRELREAAREAKQSAGEYDGDEWFTPIEYLAAVRAVFGTIDLDPASCEAAQAVVQATHYYTKADNGLASPWFGKVFCNPPYSMPLIQQFTEQAAAQYENGNCEAVILLVNNCTDARWFIELAEQYPLMFSRGRAAFWQMERDNFATRQGQAIFYLGSDAPRFIEAFQSIAYMPNTEVS